MSQTAASPTPPSQLILIGGGARSGKSRFALGRALERGPRRLFVATGEPIDDEMRSRFERHRLERGGRFRTVELPYEPETALVRPEADVIVVDCLTLWIGNLLVRGDGVERIEAALEHFRALVCVCPVPVVVVSNEVGLGVVPDNLLTRTFRDLVGRGHQRLSEVASELYFAAMGVVLRLKPGPVEVVR